jgi:hypothetical protein
MYPKLKEMPTPLATLDDLMESGDASEKPFKVFIGHNLGNRTFLTLLPMHEFFGLSEVANDRARDGDTIAQRKLDPAHAQKLAVYLLKGLVAAAIERFRIKNQTVPQAFLDVQEKLGKQPYLSLQPLVVNIRECDPAGANLRGERLLADTNAETVCFRVYLGQRHILWVIDGQHRRKGMEIVFAFLEHVRSTGSYAKKGSLFPSDDGVATKEELSVWEECFSVARGHSTVAVEVHLGLSPEEERQLFHDLNNLGKKVETSLALQFDNSNPINLFIKDTIIGELGFDVVEKDITDWHADTGAVSRKDLVAVNAILFLNKTNIGGATPPLVSPKVELAKQFWTAVSAIPGFGEEQAKEQTVAAQPVVLKALAKLVYDFAFSPRRDDDADVYLEKLLSSLSDIDLSHSNPMWRYYEMSEVDRESNGLKGLAEYLPPTDDGANRDIGAFQNGYMRFGAKHNDIFPIISDMVRWQLDLPKRQHVKKSRQK